jgi:RNA polymerase-binding transcription factor DksA
MSDPVSDLQHLDEIEGELTDVDRALQHLDDGTYGTCEVCGAELPDELLAESPVARTCAGHTVVPPTPLCRRHRPGVASS